MTGGRVNKRDYTEHILELCSSPQTVSQLQVRTGANKTTVAAVVKRLVEKGILVLIKKPTFAGSSRPIYHYVRKASNGL